MDSAPAVEATSSINSDVIGKIPEIFRSVSGLVAAGGNGLAAIIFVAVMIVIVISLLFVSKMTVDMVRLTKWYLVTGAVCVALSLAVGVVDRFLGASYDVHVAISPALDTKGYPVPVVRADTVVVPIQTKFPVNHSMGIEVAMDGTLAYLEDLTKAKIVAENAALSCADAINEQNVQLAGAKDVIANIKTGLNSGSFSLPSWANAQFDAVDGKLNSITKFDPDAFIVKNDLVPSEYLPAPNESGSTLPG